MSAGLSREVLIAPGFVIRRPPPLAFQAEGRPSCHSFFFTAPIQVSSAMFSSLFAVSTALAFVGSANAHHGHHHAIAKRLVPSPTSSAEASWYHPEGAKYHNLFRRGPATDGAQYSDVGSPGTCALSRTSG
jgi:hypothetical protein